MIELSSILIINL